MRHRRVRKRVNGDAGRPRLSVFRSHRHIYAQVIDDRASRTLAASSTLDPELGAPDGDGKIAAAEAVGAALAKRAISAGIRSVVFDRGGYKYHGRVKALAEAARKEGLNF
jgi:large subunit ribosomal protein L18